MRDYKNYKAEDHSDWLPVILFIAIAAFVAVIGWTAENQAEMKYKLAQCQEEK